MMTFLGYLRTLLSALTKSGLWLASLSVVEFLVAIAAVVRKQCSIRTHICPTKNFMGVSFTMAVYIAIASQCFSFICSVLCIMKIENTILDSFGLYQDGSSKPQVAKAIAFFVSAALSFIVDRKATGFVVPCITGGMASGKSTLADMLVKEGFTSNDADSIYHELIAKDEPLYHDIIEIFGKGILDSRGEIDRTKLGQAIQRDPSNQGMEQISKISHPQIFYVMLSKLWNRTSLFSDETAQMFLEVPLLFETKLFSYLCCPIINVAASQKERYARFKRRTTSEQKTMKLPKGQTMKIDDKAILEHWNQMINNQCSDELREELSDYTLKNDGTIKDLQKQMKRILKFIA